MDKHDSNSAAAEPSFDPFADEWLTTREAARLLGLTPDTLRDYRAKGRSPRFYKRGHFVFYSRADLRDWTSERVRRDGEG